MIGAPRHPEKEHGLPLTEGSRTPNPVSAASEADIRALVDSFYETIRGDGLLGPIFARHVSDWSLHLPKMYDFWSTVVLHSGRYSGRPIEAHLRIPGLSARHFARWLTLWESTVDRVIGRPRGDAFVIAARRMAASMASRVLPAGDEE